MPRNAERIVGDLDSLVLVANGHSPKGRWLTVIDTVRGQAVDVHLDEESIAELTAALNREEDE